MNRRRTRSLCARKTHSIFVAVCFLGFCTCQKPQTFSYFALSEWVSIDTVWECDARSSRSCQFGASFLSFFPFSAMLFCLPLFHLLPSLGLYAQNCLKYTPWLAVVFRRFQEAPSGFQTHTHTQNCVLDKTNRKGNDETQCELKLFNTKERSSKEKEPKRKKNKKLSWQSNHFEHFFV